VIATLGAALETAGALTLAAALASAVTALGLRGLGRLSAAPAVRADLALALAALPAALALALAVAVSAPGLLDLAGVAPDHCHAHGGHGHLCIAHPAEGTLPLQIIGALGLLSLVGRATVHLRDRIHAARDLQALMRLGRPDAEGPDVLCLDGSVVLCHAAGVLRPRVLISTRLRAALGPELLQAALAHERAHLIRHDVLTRDLIALFGLFAWPGLGTQAAATWEAAAEEAADAAVAAQGRGLALAGALVAVARLSLPKAPSALSLDGARLSRRVGALLNGTAWHAPARGLRLLPAGALALLGLTAALTEPLHHAVETATHLLLGD